MKNEFVVLKDRQKIKIELSRDSVCAGDDCDSHKKIIEIYSFIDPEILVSNIYIGYLPGVIGNKHSWDCILNGKVIAIIEKDVIIKKVFQIEYIENNKIHFRYNA